jgi:ubiquinone/menaquinone biosynthesis C-methylase UbiE
MKMNPYNESINNHYGQVNLGENILAACEGAGVDMRSLTRDDIAGVEEFHIRGRVATRELAQLANIKPGMKILDIGCGVGGPARTLAAEYNCEVVGLDVVDEYCKTAELLTSKVGLSDKVSFRQGSVLDMPFVTSEFDAVWSQHMTMNIEDKRQLFREVRRVLRPGGIFVIYEILAGSVSPIYFPVPWAGDSSINFLETPEEIRMALKDANFNDLEWRDVTGVSLEWAQGLLNQMASRPKDAKPPVGLNLLMGKTTPLKVKNMTLNLQEDRVRVVQAVMN